MWKPRLINDCHLLCCRTVSSVSSANAQKRTMSLDLCHFDSGGGNPKFPHLTESTCKRLDSLCNQLTAQPTEQTTFSQPSNHHAHVIAVAHTHEVRRWARIASVMHTCTNWVLNTKRRVVVLMRSYTCHRCVSDHVMCTWAFFMRGAQLKLSRGWHFPHDLPYDCSNPLNSY